MRAPRPTAALRTAFRALHAVFPATAVCGVCLMAAAACGGYSPVGRLDTPALPDPDVCADLPADLVAAALGGEPSSCLTADDDDGAHGTRFTATKGRKASLVVSYVGRYDRDTGLDMWEVYGYVEKQRVSLIGVGEDAVYDPETGVAAAVEGQLIVRVAVQTADGAAPSEEAAEVLMPVLEAALRLGSTTEPTPSQRASVPVIAP